MLFHHVQKLESNKLKIPYALRAQLNLYEATREYLTIQRVTESNTNYCELLISPISFEMRKDLWLLKAEFKDRVGIINDISVFLRNQNIDILSFKAVTIDNSTRLAVEVLFDCQFYNSSFDKSSEFRNENYSFTLSALKSKFVASFIENIEFLPNTSKPKVILTKNHSLNDSINDKRNRRHISEIENSKINIPQNMFKDVRNHLLEANGHITFKESEALMATIVSEPSNNFFRVYLFVKNTGIIHVRIKYRNKTGSVAAITKVIRDSNINIIHLNSRNIGNAEYSLSDMVIKSENHDLLSDKAFKEHLKQVYTDSEYREEYNWNIDIEPRLIREANENFFI